MHEEKQEDQKLQSEVEDLEENPDVDDLEENDELDRAYKIFMMLEQSGRIPFEFQIFP